MWSDRYAEECPFSLPKAQLPPTRPDFSKQSKGMPRLFKALTTARPLDPAPMTHAIGWLDMMDSFQFRQVQKFQRTLSLRRLSFLNASRAGSPCALRNVSARSPR